MIYHKVDIGDPVYWDDNATDLEIDTLKQKAIRNNLLAESDKYLLGDFPTTKLEEWIVSNKNVQKTDLEKAVDYGFEKGAKRIHIVGWSGGRIDHTLAALGLAFNPKISLIDENFTIKAVNDSEIIKGEEKTLFSLMAMPEARVSVTGARWNLQHEQLKMGGRGIHNEIGSSCEVTIECHSGNLLVILGNFVLPHA